MVGTANFDTRSTFSNTENGRLESRISCFEPVAPLLSRK